MTAVKTWAISRVQVTLGVPSNDGVRKVSSSIATTTAGKKDGAYGLPKTCQRNAVRKSIERPRTASSAGEAATSPATSAMRRAASAVSGSHISSIESAAGGSR